MDGERERERDRQTAGRRQINTDGRVEGGRTRDTETDNRQMERERQTDRGRKRQNRRVRTMELFFK